MRVLARDGVAKVHAITAPLLAVSFVLVLAVHVPHVGVSVNGARRWIGAGPLQFQPSELMKLALVLYCGDAAGQAPAARARPARARASRCWSSSAARCLLVVHPARPRHGDGDRVHDRARCWSRPGIPMRKLGDDRRLRARRWCSLYALVRPYARARLTSFLDPWAHASRSGFQAVQGQIAIGSGGLFGVGPGQSVQKIFYLPEAPTDFILAVIAEELGVVGRVRAAVPLRPDRLRRACARRRPRAACTAR